MTKTPEQNGSSDSHGVPDGGMMKWPGLNPALFLCHGFTGCGADFTLLAEQLKYRAEAIDLPGHDGRPVAPDKFPSFDEVSWMIADTVTPNTCLLGYSMGGRMALNAVISHRAQPRALILIGASPGIGRKDEQNIRIADDERKAQFIMDGGVHAFLQYWNAQPLIATQQRIEPRHQERMRALRQRHHPSGLAASLRHHGTGRMPSLWPRLAEIEIPVLLITGALDVKFRDIAAAMHARIPNAQWHEISDAGHCAHLENVDATTNAIEHFVDNLVGTI